VLLKSDLDVQPNPPQNNKTNVLPQFVLTSIMFPDQSKQSSYIRCLWCYPHKQAVPKTDINLKKHHLKHNNDYHPTQTAIKIDELPVPPVLEQVASKKSSLILTIKKQSTQTSQLFTKIIKMENIDTSN